MTYVTKSLKKWKNANKTKRTKEWVIEMIGLRKGPITAILFMDAFFFSKVFVPGVCVTQTLFDCFCKLTQNVKNHVSDASRRLPLNFGYKIQNSCLKTFFNHFRTALGAFLEPTGIEPKHSSQNAAERSSGNYFWIKHTINENPEPQFPIHQFLHNVKQEHTTLTKFFHCNARPEENVANINLITVEIKHSEETHTELVS